MALLNITLGTTPTPSGKPEYMVAKVPLTFGMAPNVEDMDTSQVVVELNQLALQGWRVVTSDRMRAYLLYTLFRIAP